MFFDGTVIEPSNVPRFLYFNLVLLIILFALFFSNKNGLLPSIYFFSFLIAFYLLTLCSTCWSFNKADAIYEAQKVCLAITLILLVFNYVHNQEEEWLLVKSLCWIGVLYVCYSIYQIFQLPNFQPENLYEIMAFAEHKNLLASFLFLLISFFLYAFFFSAGVLKYVGLGLTGITVLLLLFLQVRSVYFAMTVSGALLFIYALFAFRHYRKKIVLILLVGGILMSAFLLTNPTILKRLNVFSYAASDSGSERLKIWSKTMELIQENPAMGVGAGNWQYNYSKYGVSNIENISRNEISFQRPHNDLLWIVSETGFPGGALILSIIGFIFIKSYPEIKKRNHKTILFFSFLAGLLVESLFSFPKERVSHIVLASVMLALLLRTLNVSYQVSYKTGKRIIFVFAILACFSLVVGAYRLRGEYYTTLLLNAKGKNNANDVITFGHKAISAFYLTDPTSTPIYTFLGWAYSSKRNPDSVLYVSKRAFSIAPYDYEVLSNYGLALEKAGQREEARKKIAEALRINESYEPALINMFILEYNAKNYVEAYKWLSRIPESESKYARYHDKIMQKLNKQEQ